MWLQLTLLNFLKNTAMMGGLLFIAATESQPNLLPALHGQTVGVNAESSPSSVEEEET